MAPTIDKHTLYGVNTGKTPWDEDDQAISDLLGALGTVQNQWLGRKDPTRQEPKAVAPEGSVGYYSPGTGFVGELEGVGQALSSAGLRERVPRPEEATGYDIYPNADPNAAPIGIWYPDPNAMQDEQSIPLGPGYRWAEPAQAGSAGGYGAGTAATPTASTGPGEADIQRIVEQVLEGMGYGPGGAYDYSYLGGTDLFGALMQMFAQNNMLDWLGLAGNQWPLGAYYGNAALR